ncbi:SDR family NAD(P)-dependent oxidoreductase [Cryptosporangium sp. NPDC048952]|uniref:SDR family NAD(P)-dependent oxidoreductase n=1 Tax=Cryptosporangium sp. NPDC048952 TaxID=3363961 RepID=UPI00371EAE80
MSAPRPCPAEVAVVPVGSYVGRTALVTGAGSGIGRAVAHRLVELGAIVVGVGRRIAPLEETAAGSPAPERMRVQALDIRDRGATSDFVESLGPLDLLVNNAGGQFIAPATAISARGFAAVADLNLTAIAATIRAAHPALARAAHADLTRGAHVDLTRGAHVDLTRGAHVDLTRGAHADMTRGAHVDLTRGAQRGPARMGARVVTLSLTAPDRGSAGMVHSTTARAALAGLTRTLARTWRDDGIALFCLAPGTVHTAGVAGELPAATLQRVVDSTPFGRDTSLHEVAEWVAALGTGIADAVSGSFIEIDGGAGLVDAASRMLDDA